MSGTETMHDIAPFENAAPFSALGLAEREQAGQPGPGRAVGRIQK